MARLLYIEASPRKARSYSIRVANAFLDAYSEAHPHHKIDTIDLWNYSLPPLNGDTINAKYAVMHNCEPTDAQRKAWGRVKNIFEEFNDADKYLLSLPMWNFGIPYALKHYIDVITQPGLAFSVTPEGGYTGLVTDRPIIVIYARGGAYGVGTGAEVYDAQKPYMEQWLEFIGFRDIRSVLIEPTLASGPETATQKLDDARAEARRLAENY